MVKRGGALRRALALCAALPAAAPAAGLAQEPGRFEIAGGYSFAGSSALVDGYGAGWALGGAWNAAPWLALDVEVGGNAQRQDVGWLQVDAGFASALAGPRFAARFARLRPFARVLAGRATVDLQVASDVPVPGAGGVSDSSPALQLGGGVDVPVEGGVAVRIALDFQRVFAPRPFTRRRVLTAVVYAFPPRPPATAAARAAP